ncbi:hypothetical protein IV102_09885 [bacterium]|nr:hypothetical protein [bacterium]
MTWQGQVEAYGLWFPPGWLQSPRLAAAWLPGCRLLCAPPGLLLVFPVTRRIRAECAAGLPVVVQGQGWSGFERGKPEPGQLALLWQGQHLVHTMHQLLAVDLARLWDCKGWSYAEGQPLSSPRGRPIYRAPRSEEVRSILPAIPAPAPQREQMLERIRRPQPAGSRNLLLGFFDLLKSLFGSPENQHYMAKMVELFERQQWQEALRYAIPLDNSLPKAQLEKFLGVLRPRSSLDFTSPNPGGAAIGTSLQGMDLLRALYKGALQKLVQAGRIEEAAFLQGELLDDAAGAVELLETHGRLEAAARLATLKGLPASQQVRLWFQAGQVHQALVLARRYSVQAEAMVHLRAKDPQLALRFRAVWAEDLASVGREAEALSVGWEVRAQLPDYSDWLEQALKEGGAAAVQAMGLCLQDQGLRQQLGLTWRLEEWFEDTSLATHERRQAVLQQLIKHPLHCQDADLQAWALRTARQLMRQAHSPFALGNQQTLNYLVTLSNDPWLKADRPSSLPSAPQRLGLWRERVEQRGHTPLWDAAALSDGRLLVALGHAGLLAISSSGAVSQRFDTPAHSLVAPCGGERFLALSGPRISSYHRGRIEAWCSSHVDGFASQHDGYHWLVWLENQLYQIDLTDLRVWRAVTQLRLPSSVLRLALGPRRLAVLLEDALVTCDYPSLHNVSQSPATFTVTPQLLTPAGLDTFELMSERLRYRGTELNIEGVRPEASYQDGYCLVVSHLLDGLSLLVFATESRAQQLLVNLPGATRMGMRVQGHTLTICDDLGRLMVADLKARQWLRQHFL